MHFLPIWLLLVTLAKIGGTLKHNSDTDRGLLVVQYFVWLSFRLIPSRNTASMSGNYLCVDPVHYGSMRVIVDC